MVAAAGGAGRVTWDRTMLALGFVVAALGLVVAIGVGLDQHWADEKIIYALNQSLQTTQTALEASQAENAAVSSVSLDTFLQQYNDHVATLKSAGETYDATKAAKGSDIVGSGGLAVARSTLYEAADNFADFVDRWRLAAEAFNKMLDGSVTRLENSRRENTADGVHDAARRVVSSAPDLATPLRVALDKLRPAP
jgi:hypothetical protein